VIAKIAEIAKIAKIGLLIIDWPQSRREEISSCPPNFGNLGNLGNS
jgi:hypothetical protein